MIQKWFNCRSLLIVLTALAICSTPAYADSFRMRLDAGGEGTVIEDTDGDGVITFDGYIGGGFSLKGLVARSDPSLPITPGIGQLQFSATEIGAMWAGTVVITLEDTYTHATGPMIMGSSTYLDWFWDINNSGNTVTVNAWANGGNSVPNLGPLQGVGPIGAMGSIPSGSLSPFGPTGVTFTTGYSGASGDVNFNNTGDTGYSMFQQIVINFAGNGFAVIGQNQGPPVANPEPTSLLLLGSGLASMGFWRRKKT